MPRTPCPTPVMVMGIAAGLAALAAVSCDSPFEPRGDGERVPLGEVITHDVALGTSRGYSFLARGGEAYAVFLEATSGAVSLSVVDSVSQRQVATLSARVNGPPMAENATPISESAKDAVYLIRVGAWGDSAAQFRFMVYRVDRNPEQRGSWFSIGDTVQGEAIDPMVDEDDFLVRGEAGEEVVAVLDAQAPAGVGALDLAVVEAVSHTGLGYVTAVAGEPVAWTTGRMRFPGTGAYQFMLRARAAWTRYRGPYRFWSYRVNRVPERVSPLAPLGAEITGEAIDRAGDVDEFTLLGTPGAEVNAFLQAPRNFHLEVVPPGGSVIGEVTVQPGSAAKLATGRFKLSGTTPYVVRVSGSSPGAIADTGTYGVFLYPIDRRPERAAAALVPGDTVSDEAIDMAGDIDEFTFAASAGQEFNALLQNLSGTPDGRQHLAVLGPVNPAEEAWSPSFPPDTVAQATGRFVVGVTGTYAVRVLGATDLTDQDVGPYRLCLYAIDRRPEHVNQTLAFGDSVSGEAIDVPGDVDEFHVTVPDTSGADLVVQLGDDASSGMLEVALIDAATSKQVGGALAEGPGWVGFSGQMQLSPGVYTLRVQGREGRSRLGTSYRLWLYRFLMGPEVAPDTIAVGDTVSVEALEPPGDVDDFWFYGEKGQHVTLALQGMAVPSSGGFQAILNGPVPPYRNPLVTVVSPTSSAALGDHQSLRLDLPATGWYSLSVRGAEWLGSLEDHGAYRVTVTPVSTAPERVSANLAPGDSVTEESIDPLGDWDEYTVTASPGQELGVVLQELGAAGYVRVVAWDPVTGDSLAGVIGQGQELAGPFTVPAGGRVTLAVFEERGAISRYFYTGGYRLLVVPINRGPESVPAAYAVGDTIRGEAIFPAGDIDEFTSTGTAGDTLDFWCRLAADPLPAGGMVSFHVVDPATEVVLVGLGKALWRSSPAYGRWGTFVVPSSGTYLIRVLGTSPIGDEVATAPYEFVVTRRR